MLVVYVLGGGALFGVVSLGVAGARVVDTKLQQLQGTSEMERQLLVKRRQGAGEGLGLRRTLAGGLVHGGDSVVRARKTDVFVDDFRHLVTVVVAANVVAVLGIGAGHQGGRNRQ